METLKKDSIQRRNFLGFLAAGGTAGFLNILLNLNSAGTLFKNVLFSNESVSKLIANNKTNIKSLAPFIHPFARPLKVSGLGQVLSATMGQAATVYIDEKNGVVHKHYMVNGVNSGGSKPLEHLNSRRKMLELYSKEKAALKLLGLEGSKYIASDIVFDDKKQIISQPYLGPDLLVRLKSEGFQLKEHHIHQLLEMFEEYRHVGIFKQNMALSNLLYDEREDRLKAIDFKFHVPRNDDSMRFEIHNLVRWLYKYDNSLPGRISETFIDFPRAKVNFELNSAINDLVVEYPDFLNRRTEELRYLKTSLRDNIEDHIKVVQDRVFFNSTV